VQFIVDCLRSVLDWHAITVMVAALLISLVVLIQTLWRAAVQTWLRAHLVLAACVVLTLVSGWATYFVMPSFLLSDLLFENTGPQHYFDVGLLARFTAEQTWNEIVESHPSGNCGSQNGSQWKLESRFASALMLLAFLWWAWPPRPAWAPRSRQKSRGLTNRYFFCFGRRDRARAIHVWEAYFADMFSKCDRDFQAGFGGRGRNQA
jgi:hypothetical protein